MISEPNCSIATFGLDPEKAKKIYKEILAMRTQPAYSFPLNPPFELGDNPDPWFQDHSWKFPAPAEPNNIQGHVRNYLHHQHVKKVVPHLAGKMVQAEALKELTKETTDRPLIQVTRNLPIPPAPVAPPLHHHPNPVIDKHSSNRRPALRITPDLEPEAPRRPMTRQRAREQEKELQTEIENTRRSLKHVTPRAPAKFAPTPINKGLRRVHSEIRDTVQRRPSLHSDLFGDKPKKKKNSETTDMVQNL